MGPHSRAAEDLIRDWVRIPTLPQVVAKINAVIDDPEVGLREVGRLVAEDPPLASQVLKTANSAYYGFSQRVVSLEHAAALLGSRVLRNIALQASVMRLFSHQTVRPEFDPESLWRHSILTGQMCWTLAFRCRAELGIAPEEFYVIGLLHDLGRFVLLDALGEEYLEIARRSLVLDTPLHVCERNALGFHHADVGRLVATCWSFPALVCDAIGFHHGPREAVASDPRVAIIANVNLLMQYVEARDLPRAGAVIDEATRRFLRIDRSEADDLVLYAVEMHGAEGD